MLERQYSVVRTSISGTWNVLSRSRGHDSNPQWVELEVHSLSVKVELWMKYICLKCLIWKADRAGEKHCMMLNCFLHLQHYSSFQYLFLPRNKYKFTDHMLPFPPYLQSDVKLSFISPYSCLVDVSFLCTMLHSVHCSCMCIHSQLFCYLINCICWKYIHEDWSILYSSMLSCIFA